MVTMTKWDPLDLELPDRLRRWLDFGVDTDNWMKVEELREDDIVTVRAELPGFDPDHDIDIWILDGKLHITAKRERTEQSKDHGAHRSEFHYGEFTRTLPIPTGVDTSAITATYRDGILEVRVPIVNEMSTTSTKIPITRK